MKLTFAANHGEMGGGEVMLFAMAELARELGHEVTVVAPSTPPDVVGHARELGLRTVEIRADGAPAYLAGLRRWDSREREGLLWCNGLRPAFATAGHRGRVVHLHQVPVGKLRLVARIATQGACEVVVPSQYMADAVAAEARVLHNWSPAIEPEVRESTHDVPRVGFIGRLSMEKGIGDLAEALRQLDADSVPFRLVLAGTARFVDDTTKRAVEGALAPLEDRIDRLGWVRPETFFGEVDLVVIPSAREESFGLVVTEAMSARRPLVVTNAGAIPELVETDYPWLARKRDPADLARVIRDALLHPDPERTAANHRRWQEHFSPAAGRKRFAALLADLERTIA